MPNREQPRKQLRKLFREWLSCDIDEWTFEDDVLLHEFIVIGLEIFTGEDGERIFREVMTQARALSRYRKLAQYLKEVSG